MTVIASVDYAQADMGNIRWLGFLRLMGRIVFCSGMLVVSALGEDVVQRGARCKAVSNMAGQQSSDPDFYLLIIAIDHYAHWQDLSTPVADAKALSHILQSEYLFDPERTTLLLNEEATRSSVVSALRKLEAQTGENDSVLIYYAGHGHKDGYWIPYDGETQSRSRWISTQLIKDSMRMIPARHILLISDSCFSGGFIMRGAKQFSDARPEMPRRLRTLYNRKSRFALTSGGNEPVKDSGVSDEHSVFAHFLLEALRLNNAPYVIPAEEELFGVVFNGVMANPLAPELKQTPHYGEMIDTGSSAGQFVFFRRSFDPKLAQTEVRPIVPIGIKPDTDLKDEGELALPVFSDRVHLLITNPRSGRLRVGRGKTMNLTGATQLSLKEGRHPFALELETGERVGGILTVHDVDEEASVTTFGYKRGIFFQPTHIQAALEGRPVRYSVRLDSTRGERDVISYIMSLTN